MIPGDASSGRLCENVAMVTAEVLLQGARGFVALKSKDFRDSPRLDAQRGLTGSTERNTVVFAWGGHPRGLVGCASWLTLEGEQ